MAKSYKNIKYFSNSKYLVSIFLLLFIVTNFVNAIFYKDNITKIKSDTISFSKGTSYNAILNFWVSTLKSQDWQSASRLEKFIEKEDIQKYLQIYHPNFLELKAQTISQNKEITVEDYMELAKIYTNLSQYQNANDALFKARHMDLLRQDIEKVSNQLNNNKL